MHKLETIEATCNRLLEIANLRQQFLDKQKEARRSGKEVKRIPKSVRIGARRFRTAYHSLLEVEQLTSHGAVLASRVPSPREQILQIRDQAVAAISGLQAPIDWQQYAENRLKQQWAEMRLVASKPGIVMRRVAYYAGTLFMRDNGWSQQTVGRDEYDRPIPRYAAIVNSLEASLVKPAGAGFRVRN